MQHKVVHEYICIVELIQLFFAQVPCYVFASDGRKHDLSPLIKLKDGYLVDDGEDSIDFYINICRSLSEYLKERKWLDSVIMSVFFVFFGFEELDIDKVCTEQKGSLFKGPSSLFSCIP